MKNILTAILFFLAYTSFAQDYTKIDNLTYKCTYLLSYQPDSNDVNNIRVEEMLLLIGDKSSKFLSLGTYQKDSVMRNVDASTMNMATLMGMLSNFPKTRFKSTIFKNYPNNKITVTEKLPPDHFKYEEDLNLFDWQIQAETKTISGYKCQKALTYFAGRKYIAWFASEIPINDGPYKFNGLPGLIVQIQDSKKQYQYELFSFQKMNNKNENIDITNKNYIKLTKKEFFKTKKEAIANMLQRLSQSGISINFDDPEKVKRDLKQKSKTRNNPIELVY